MILFSDVIFLDEFLSVFNTPSYLFLKFQILLFSVAKRHRGGQGQICLEINETRSLYKLPGLPRPLPRPRQEAKHCIQIGKFVKERYYKCNWLRHCHFPTMTPSESYLFCLVGWSEKSSSKETLLGFYGIHLHDLQSLLCVIKLLTGISGRKGFQKYFCCSLSY